MSSHHIVKEKQEPALYIHNMDNFDEEYLGQILEWSPTVIVNGSIYEKIVSLGLKVDVIVNAPEGLLTQENTKFILGPGDEYNTVMNYLISEKYAAVNVIDIDKALADLAFYLQKINIVMFSATEKSYAVKSGFKVWKPAGFVFIIDLVSYFEASNLMQTEEREFIVVEDGFVDFTFTTAEYLFLTERL